MGDKNYPESDPRHHTAKIKRMLTDVGKITEPKAQALFETTAEVLQGLAKAFEHYDTGAEPAMQTQAKRPANKP
jgi:hypothetical protein